jgi:hypothetical protein
VAGAFIHLPHALVRLGGHDVVFHALLQRLTADGLVDIIHRAQLQAAGLRLLRHVAGEEDDRYGRKALVRLDVLYDLDAVHVVHVDVQQYQIGLFGLQKLNHLFAGRELGHPVCAGQDGLYRIVCDDVVVDDKYVLHLEPLLTLPKSLLTNLQITLYCMFCHNSIQI